VHKVRVFLVDDHALVRDGLRAVVSAQPDMEVVGEAGDGASIVDRVAASGAEVVVMDVTLPHVSGAKATEDLRRHLGQVKILALSAHEDRGYVEQMLAVGASGYIVKRSAAEELIRAIRCVSRGETYIDPSMGGMLLAAAAAAEEPGSFKLSERETEVLRLIARGLPMKEIAASLDIGVRTIETYRARAMEKAGLHSRADVVRFAAERGWLTGA
jgi:DNA-binding NarL/FixJ family response regulator